VSLSLLWVYLIDSVKTKCVLGILILILTVQILNWISPKISSQHVKSKVQILNWNFYFVYKYKCDTILQRCGIPNGEKTIFTCFVPAHLNEILQYGDDKTSWWKYKVYGCPHVRNEDAVNLQNFFFFFPENENLFERVLLRIIIIALCKPNRGR